MGVDTYTVSGRSRGGSGKAKQVAVKKANAYAAEKGLYMIPIQDSRSTNYSSGGALVYEYELTFRLVDENDPEYRRTRPKRDPDIQVEVKKD